VLASRLRIRTYPSGLRSNHEIRYSHLRRIRFARTNARGYSALSVQHATPVGNGGRLVAAMNNPCVRAACQLRSAETVSAQPSASPELLHQSDAPTLRPPVRLVHSASGGIEQRTSARSSGRKPSSREAVRALLREYHQLGNRHARDRVIQQYMPLVKSLARRHSNRGELTRTSSRWERSG
jgi:DNA-directed RNA polymerase specialized sigma subunit